jgi:predicted nucleic acid-binding Zn ribbon protein
MDRRCTTCKYWQRNKEASDDGIILGDCEQLGDSGQRHNKDQPSAWAWWGDYGGFVCSYDFHCAFWSKGEHRYCKYCGEEIPIDRVTELCDKCHELQVRITADQKLAIRILMELNPKDDSDISNLMGG